MNEIEIRERVASLEAKVDSIIVALLPRLHNDLLAADKRVDSLNNKLWSALALLAVNLIVVVALLTLTQVKP
jgi:hypothetical protein